MSRMSTATLRQSWCRSTLSPPASRLLRRSGFSSLRRLVPSSTAAPLVPHPLVTPSTAIVAKAPARAVPPVQARPVVETRQGFERAGSPGTPVRAPQPPAAVNRPAGQPQLTATQPINRAGFPQQRQPQVIAPAPMAHPAPTAQVPVNNRLSPEDIRHIQPQPPPSAMERPAPVPQPSSAPACPTA